MVTNAQSTLRFKSQSVRQLFDLQGSKGGQVSLLNIITELKKTCNHPFLFESAEEDYRGGEDDLNAVDRLVVTSGKMVLLDKLMKRLKETGHRSVSLTHSLVCLPARFSTKPAEDCAAY